ncbi:hypothetical protein ABT187_04915 [Streptomyces sp. NPDC001817]|uniref:hypothetical protein n=1 Tax=Streptomyces sp. NPDC001817 TaxID=3154398 RepID=UPI003333FFFA
MSAVLHGLVEAAGDLIGARYGALGVLGEGGAFTDLITVGIDDPHLCAAMGMPKGHGVLHTLVADRRPLRVAELMVRGTVYGDLYLADKTDGTPFNDDCRGVPAVSTPGRAPRAWNTRRPVSPRSTTWRTRCRPCSPATTNRSLVPGKHWPPLARSPRPPPTSCVPP